MHRALAGQALLHTDFRVPRLAGADLSGQAVLEVVPRGKHMLLRTDAGWTVHTHFRMDGDWILYRRGDRWNGPAHEIRVVLETAEWIAVGYRLPVIDVVPTHEEARLVGHLGPDLLADDFDLDEALRRLREHPHRSVAEALLDQSCLAGVGNVYKNEVLFVRRVDPFQAVGDVPDLAAVVTQVQRMLRANRDVSARSTTGFHRTGDRLWVYDRAGQPCRRCRTPIRVIRQGAEPTVQRITWWCPRCQASAPRG